MLKAESFNQDQVTDGKVDRHPVSSLFETYQECPEEAATEVQGNSLCVHRMIRNSQ